MSRRMLIDSSHPEETRVVVLDGQKVEEFDFEAATKRPLKGNIYLAKITRVEPSLQAAFVEYGGNRQGFLAFSEIHPDYYQIPIADRQALIAEQEEEARRQAEREDAEDEAEAAAVARGEPASPPRETLEGDNAREEASTLEGGDVLFDNSSEQPAAPESETDSESDDYFPPPSHHAEPDEDVHARFAHDKDDHPHDGHSEDADHAPSPEPVDPDEEVAEDIVDEQAAANASFAAPAESDDPDNESDSVHEGLGEDTDGEAAGAVDAAQEIAEGIVDEQAAANASFDLTSQQSAETPHEQSSQPLQQRRPSQRWTRRKHYKIQEVIKRRQIILVQVVKEERGNKGAALTTYLSLAGRYCVLMPNTPRGGGISRKITSASDRKRLKGAVQGLELPEGMGLIIRTAGENRTKVEIKRDYEYLLRMWDTVRELTLESNAPACVYEEGDLIKRAIRDLYNKDVSEVIVEGDAGYKNAKDFMRMLMPSHAKNVKPYKEPVPLFQRHHIEAQLDAMFSPTVNLKSGGYIVINQTEALVSIDVNSGRATREHSIEETAHKTNLEAADEIGRQLRLRDLAGLVVIDFIDMEDHRNDRNVEKRLYNAVKNDRARIQIGKISQFGLLEMSRQRLRAGVIAGSTVPCPHCGGQGIVRSVESTALRVLRGIEDEAQKLKASAVLVKVSTDVAVYTLNQKRRELARIEDDYGMAVGFAPDDTVHVGDFEIVRTVARDPDDKPRIAMQMDAPLTIADVEEDEVVEEDIAEIETEDGAEGVSEASSETADRSESRSSEARSSEEGGRRRRRRGGRNRSRNRGDRDQAPEARPAEQQASGDHDAEPVSYVAPVEDAVESNGEFAGSEQPRAEGETDEGPRRRRRRRRGRRGHRDSDGTEQGEHAEAAPESESTIEAAAGDASNQESDGPVPNASSTPVWSLTPEPAPVSEPASTPVAEPVAAKPEPVAAEPAAETPAKVEAPVAVAPVSEAPSRTEEPKMPVAAQQSETTATDAPSAPPRKGWWQRTFSAGD